MTDTFIQELDGAGDRVATWDFYPPSADRRHVADPPLEGFNIVAVTNASAAGVAR